MKFVIPGRLPGLNEMIDAARRNKHESAKQKKIFTELIAWIIKEARIPKMEACSLKILWIEQDRKRDPDNVQAGVKYIWDALVLAGVLENDGWKQQRNVEHSMAVDKDEPRIEVLVLEYFDYSKKPKLKPYCAP